MNADRIFTVSLIAILCSFAICAILMIGTFLCNVWGIIDTDTTFKYGITIAMIMAILFIVLAVIRGFIKIKILD